MVLRWVFGLSEVSGNEKANATTKDMEHKGGKETNHWSSLKYIKTKLQKARSAEFQAWHESKSQEKQATAQ